MASREAKNNGRSADLLARQITEETGSRVSGATIERMRYVTRYIERSGDVELQAQVEAGEIAPYTAYKRIRERHMRACVSGGTGSGLKMATVQHCRSCGAGIIWLKNERTGKPAPINAEPDPNGTIYVVPDMDTYLIPTTREVRQWQDTDFGSWHTNHFATCPSAKRWRLTRS